MKQIFFLAITSVLLSANNKAFAQAAQMNNRDAVAGHFEMNARNAGRANPVNISYVIVPAPATGEIKLELNAPYAVLLNVDISDASGRVLKTWSPALSSNHYQDNIDISYLPFGDYNINIHKDNSNAILYSIPFTRKTPDAKYSSLN